MAFLMFGSARHYTPTKDLETWQREWDHEKYLRLEMELKEKIVDKILEKGEEVLRKELGGVERLEREREKEGERGREIGGSGWWWRSRKEGDEHMDDDDEGHGYGDPEEEEDAEDEEEEEDDDDDDDDGICKMAEAKFAAMRKNTEETIKKLEESMTESPGNGCRDR